MKTQTALTSLLFLAVAATATANNLTFQLGKELLSEGNPELAAIEFRRFAMESEKPPEQAASYLFASYAYLLNSQPRTASEMLDRAEAADSAGYLNEHTLLSAETARLARDPDTALYFYDVLAEDNSAPAFQTFARRRAAAIHFKQGNLPAAQEQLNLSPSEETVAQQAIETYANGNDKSPKIGGLWGLIPGAGYWYSGEVANGFRSLILNSLFIYGMVETAEDDQWGAFAAIAFFEVTWYSGSIYGGIDSAQRHNQHRMEETLNAIEGNLSYRPAPEIIAPIFKLKILF